MSYKGSVVLTVRFEYRYNRYALGLGAGVAQLVEYKLPKLGVAGSNPVARSRVVEPAHVAPSTIHRFPASLFAAAIGPFLSAAT